MLPATTRIRLSTAAAVLAVLGCAGERAPAAAGETAAVRITSPASGDTVALPIVIALDATGVEVIPATGTAEPGRGHHHLVIDRDLPSFSAPVPAEPGLVHIGTGAQTHRIDSLPPGRHRIIALFASGDHVPMAGVRLDTILITVP